MKTAIIIIAVCEVIRTIQITLDIVFGIQARKQTLASINKVGDSVADDFTADKLARAIVREAKAESEDGVCKDCHYNDGEVHAECVICDKAESEGNKS